MRLNVWPSSLAILAALCATSVASAEQHTESATTAAPAPAFDKEALKEEVRRELEAELKKSIADEVKAELREQLKQEIKTELANEAPMTDSGGQDDGWGEEEWKWEEPVKPALNFLEFDGYFRFRYDFFHNLDLDTYFYNALTQTESGPFTPGLAPPVPTCNRRPECANRREEGDSNSLGGANMRLRVEPIFNVYEDIKIKMQVDVFDNLILGSTPDGFPTNILTPLVAFSQTQLPPSDGENALIDSVRFKRVWAEVMTPLGQLRVGRMPSHFGMGLLANGGRGIDSDFGDSNDRIMFATKIAGHYVIPAFDWAVSGPSSALRAPSLGQPFDLDQRDDVDQYILAIAKRDKDQEIQERLDNDEMVFNYGVYGVFRRQAFDAGSYFNANEPEDQLARPDLLERNASLWAYSLWFKWLYRKFTFELEHVGIVGNIGNSALSGPFGTTRDELSIQMFGAAVRGEYRLLHDSLRIHFLTVFASGDRAPGWGVAPLLTAPTDGSWDGNQGGDGNIRNFRVDPDFQVDMILWRQLVGTVTDAIVFKPGVQYNITEGFGARLDLVYSRSIFASSTPSGVFASSPHNGDRDAGTTGVQARTPSNNLGLESDLKIFYRSDDGFHAWLEYGLLIPFSGLDRAVDAPSSPSLLLDAKVAQTIQAMLAVTF